MSRVHATPNGDVPFTADEELARDAEETEEETRRVERDAEEAGSVSTVEMLEAVVEHIDGRPGKLSDIRTKKIKR